MEDPPAEQAKPLRVLGPPDVLGQNDEFVRLVIAELIDGAARLNLAPFRGV